MRENAKHAIHIGHVECTNGFVTQLAGLHSEILGLPVSPQPLCVHHKSLNAHAGEGVGFSVYHLRFRCVHPVCTSVLGTWLLVLLCVCVCVCVCVCLPGYLSVCFYFSLSVAVLGPDYPQLLHIHL